MNIEYKYTNYEDESPEKKDFLSWALENSMFSPEHKDSRMKKVYLETRETKGLSVVVAFFESKPIGIVMCENKDMLISLDVEDLSVSSNKSKIAVSGFLSFYVKNEFREKGIAKELLKVMEQEKVKFLRDDLKNIPGNIYVGFTAAEKAVGLIMKSSSHSYPFDVKADPDEVMDFLTQGIEGTIKDLRMNNQDFIKKEPISQNLKKEVKMK